MSHLEVPTSDLPAVSPPPSPYIPKSPGSESSDEYHVPSTCKPAARIARLLDEAEVPNFMWGQWAAVTIGQCYMSQEIDFVVPGEFLQKATKVLENAEFVTCTDESCSNLNDDDRMKPQTPQGDVHFDTFHHKYFWGALKLHAKSNVTWWVPDPPVARPAEDDPFFTVTDNPGLLPRRRDEGGASGPWTKLYPIKILKPVPFTESIILVYCRDLGQQTGFDYHWRDILSMMMENGPNPDLFVKKTLRPQFQRFWELANSDDRPIWDKKKIAMAAELRKELVERNELPPPPSKRHVLL